MIWLRLLLLSDSILHLAFSVEMLDRAKQAAISAKKIGVVEVLGSQAGWLALQSGIAVLADAVILPEFPCDVKDLAQHLKSKITPDRHMHWW